jgi:hypothetical protein
MGQTAQELRQQLGEQRADISRDLNAIGDRVSPGRIVERRQAAIRQKVSGLKDKVMGAADSSAHAVRHAGDSASSALTDSASNLMHGTVDAAEGNPLAMGLVAFGAGLVVATLFPASRTERHLAQHAQPALEQAAAEAAPAARHLIDDIKPAAQDAIADLRDSATDSLETVKQHATDATAETADEAKNAVRDTVRPQP